MSLFETLYTVAEVPASGNSSLIFSGIFFDTKTAAYESMCDLLEKANEENEVICYTIIKTYVNNP